MSLWKCRTVSLDLHKAREYSKNEKHSSLAGWCLSVFRSLVLVTNSHLCWRYKRSRRFLYLVISWKYLSSVFKHSFTVLEADGVSTNTEPSLLQCRYIVWIHLLHYCKNTVILLALRVWIFARSLLRHDVWTRLCRNASVGKRAKTITHQGFVSFRQSGSFFRTWSGKCGQCRFLFWHPSSFSHSDGKHRLFATNVAGAVLAFSSRPAKHGRRVRIRSLPRQKKSQHRFSSLWPTPVLTDSCAMEALIYDNPFWDCVILRQKERSCCVFMGAGFQRRASLLKLQRRNGCKNSDFVEDKPLNSNASHLADCASV